MFLPFFVVTSCALAVNGYSEKIVVPEDIKSSKSFECEDCGSCESTVFASFGFSVKQVRCKSIPVIYGHFENDSFPVPENVANLSTNHPEFQQAAAEARRFLPASIFNALSDIWAIASKPGALLIKGLPIGDIPPTPETPSTPHVEAKQADFLMSTIGRMIGYLVGYAPEHNGGLVQNVVPVDDHCWMQTSTSACVPLEYHTETAFHPFSSRYSVLMCLRGHPAAKTYVSSIHDILPLLSNETIAILRTKSFRTGIDHSFLLQTNTTFDKDAPAQKTELMAVITGPEANPRVVYDQDLMTGETLEAIAALDAFFVAAVAVQKSIVLEAGDMIIIDNYSAIHGRGNFTTVFDGDKRFLKRMFILSELDSSAAYRDGNVITLTFEAGAHSLRI